MQIEPWQWSLYRSQRMERRASCRFERMERWQTDEKRYQFNLNEMEELGWTFGIRRSSKGREKELYQSPRGQHIYCTVTEGNPCMDIRQYWKPKDEVIPTKKGLCLRPIEYSVLKELIPEIGTTLPELDAVVPCYMQSDHMNQLGALQCSECNPNDFANWWTWLVAGCI